MIFKFLMKFIKWISVISTYFIFLHAKYKILKSFVQEKNLGTKQKQRIYFLSKATSQTYCIVTEYILVLLQVTTLTLKVKEKLAKKKKASIQ